MSHLWERRNSTIFKSLLGYVGTYSDQDKSLMKKGSQKNSLEWPSKGIVQRDLTGLSPLVFYILFYFKGHHRESQVLTTFKLNLPGEFTKSYKWWPPYYELTNLAYTGWWPYGTTRVPYSHQQAQISQGTWVQSMYGMIQYRTIILWSRWGMRHTSTALYFYYRTDSSSAGAGAILYLVP
jgi:hypothetical protein